MEIRELFDLGDDDALDADAYEWLRGIRWQQRLRDSIHATGRLQSEIAYKAGVPEETLSRIVTGQSRNPRIETVICIAHAIGITVGWLLEEPGYALSVEQVNRLREAGAVIDEVIGGVA